MTATTRCLFVVLSLVLIPSMALPQSRLEHGIDYSQGVDPWPLGRVFKTPQVAPADMANSPRLDQLVREGKLYLSLGDAIALAVENNLDIARARYGPKIADTDILRARSGAQLRGVQTQIGTLSTGQSVAGAAGEATGPEGAGLTQRAGGVTGDTGAIGDAGTFFGSPIPQLDPILSGGIDWGHFSSPQTSDFVTGTNTFVSEGSNSDLTFQKDFLTGTSLTLRWANRTQETNSLRANFDPSLRSNVTLQFRQPLMQGFGRDVNARNIQVSKNNREVSDLSFKTQVIDTVTRIQNLYWDLVSFRADVLGRQEDLRLAQKLYEDNKKRVEVGSLAPIEIVRAEAEIAARRQELTLAETRVQLQQTLLKNALSKNGLASPSLYEVEIIPTDSIEVPEVEKIQPMQDLMALALQSRPELAQSRIQLQNRDITLRGIRNAMLPRIDLVADVTNNGLAGRENQNFQGFPGFDQSVSPFFLGGLGTSLAQIFRRNFPDYSVGLQVTIPLKNRRAQADMAATLLEKRQVEIQLRQQENAIRVEVQNAVIGIQQARAQYDAARQGRILQEQTLDAEEKKYELGATTIFLVVQAQRDLALARSNETAAQGAYIKARVALEAATGQTLVANNIVLKEAYQGTVSKPADPLPPQENSSAALRPLLHAD